MPSEIRRPRVLDMNFIRNFMLVIGPISSLFDFLTFYVMLVVSAGRREAVSDWLVRRVAYVPRCW